MFFSKGSWIVPVLTGLGMVTAGAQGLPVYTFPTLPVGFSQWVVGFYAEVCPPAPQSGPCAVAEGDALFKFTPSSLRVNEDGLLYFRWSDPLAGGVPTELWRVATDGTKSKVMDLPSASECIQVDAYTLELRHAHIAEVSVKPSKAKKGESLYFHTINWVDRLRYADPVTCTSQGTLPPQFWQLMQKVTRAVIAVESAK
jgi:hypothetical protein